MALNANFLNSRSILSIPAAHFQQHIYDLRYHLYPVLSPFAPNAQEYLHQLTENV